MLFSNQSYMSNFLVMKKQCCHRYKHGDSKESCEPRIAILVEMPISVFDKLPAMLTAVDVAVLPLYHRCC